jgi:hypothetical protein
MLFIYVLLDIYAVCSLLFLYNAGVEVATLKLAIPNYDAILEKFYVNTS